MTIAEIDAIVPRWKLPKIDVVRGITPQLVQSLLALRMAEVLAEISVGDHLKSLGIEDRAWFRAQSELMVKDALLRIDLFLEEAQARYGDDQDDQQMNAWRKRDEAL
jgi:hypothetical protein